MQKQRQGGGTAPTIRKPALARGGVGGGQHYASPALPPRQTGCPLYRSLVGSRGQVCMTRNSIALGFESDLQEVATPSALSLPLK